MHLRLPATPETARKARLAVRQALAGAHLPEPVVRDVLIATAEIVANAVVHAYRPPAPPGTVEIEARLSDRLEILVRDFGGGITPHLDSEGAGLGLAIAGALADRVTLSRNPAACSTEVRLVFGATSLRVEDGFEHASAVAPADSAQVALDGGDIAPADHGEDGQDAEHQERGSDEVADAVPVDE
jgi:anti-sigma regulatory factor (Ser/Thr protein kinase)